jgi:preprotein translocase subunit YajC
MLINLLSNSGANNGGGSGVGTWIMMGILLAIIIVFMVFNRRSQQKRQQETMDMLNAIQPGNKVKTIGVICGVVVEVCPEDNTFVLETGTEASGKSYIKFDKQAVYQTDAVAKKEEPAEKQPTEQPFEEGAPVEEVTEAPVEEAPAEETTEE